MVIVASLFRPNHKKLFAFSPLAVGNIQPFLATLRLLTSLQPGFKIMQKTEPRIGQSLSPATKKLRFTPTVKLWYKVANAT
jgi:hypothetical protein